MYQRPSRSLRSPAATESRNWFVSSRKCLRVVDGRFPQSERESLRLFGKRRDCFLKIRIMRFLHQLEFLGLRFQLQRCTKPAEVSRRDSVPVSAYFYIYIISICR